MALSVIARIVVFIVGFLVTFLPRKLELWLGPMLGRLVMRLDGKRRRIAYDNIRRCLPELGPAGWEKLLRENCEHYGVLGLEILHMASPFPGHYRRYANRVAVVEGFENWKRAHDKGKGVIFLSAHLANWELMAAMGAMIGAEHGITTSMATRHLKPEWLLKKIEAARMSMHLHAAYLPNALPHVLKSLRRGHSFGFVLDQYAHPPNGVAVPFFGIKVDTLGALGTLSARYGSAIVPVMTVRDEKGIVHVRFEPELDLGEALNDQVQSTSILVMHVERWIRANPAQWLWAHRRFKNVKFES